MLHSVSPPLADRKTGLSAFQTTLVAGLVAGTLDILGVILLYVFVLNGPSPVQLLQAVASGVFGRSAFTGGWSMAALGLGLHYLIALAWAAIYVWSFPRLPYLRRQKTLSGVLYGLLVWSVMNLVVVPLSLVSPAPFRWSGAILNLALLVFLVGLPLAWLVPRFYKKAHALPNKLPS